MKYMSYYEENGRITKNDYRRIEKTLQEEAPDKFERMLLRKMEFVNVEGYISRDEELPRYYLCRKTKENHEEFLYLEKKNVQNGVVYKYCCTLTREECQAVMDGNIVWMQEHEHPLVRDLYRQMTINGLELGGLKEYERKVYQSTKDSRIVFDERIQRIIGKHVTLFEEEGMRVDCLFGHQVHISYRRDKTIPRMIANMVQNQEQVSEDFAFA